MFQASWRYAPLFLKIKKQIIFDKITAFFDFEILQCLANILRKVSIINSSYSFQAINLKLRTNVTGLLKMWTFFFEDKKITILTKYQHFYTLKLYSFWLKHYEKFVYYSKFFLQAVSSW